MTHTDIPGTDIPAAAGSVLDGGPVPPSRIATLGDALLRSAGLGHPDGLCFVRPDGSELRQGYLQLLMRASRMLTGLRAAGVRVGEPVVLQVASAPELLAAYWGCVLGGFVPLPVAAGVTPAERRAAPERLYRVWAAYQAPRVVTGAGQLLAPEAVADPRWPAAWAGDTAELLANRLDHDWHQAAPDDLAVLLPTPEGTGTPGCVMLSHRNVLSRSAAAASADGLGRDSRTLNWMPLDQLGALIMFHTRDVFLGCHQVHASPEWVREDPLRWLDAIDRHRADTTWAPGSAFALVNDLAARSAGRRWDLSCLRSVLNDGASAGSSVIGRFLELLTPVGLPEDAVHSGWGRPETSSVVVDGRFAAGSGTGRVPAGRPQPGTAVRCVDEYDRPVPPGTVGRLQVSGPAVGTGYYRDPELTRQSFTPDGWLRTGDLALIRDGALTVTGRVDAAAVRPAHLLRVPVAVPQPAPVPVPQEKIPAWAKAVPYGTGWRSHPRQAPIHRPVARPGLS
ncbi:AMP-binding protein [Kitasatospora sp. MAP5-34]|uniref:AMP-binding protein n=1 Tax=Kitasatospora sp. MAP5-34 TaxID=3035102 RepID=UPI002475605D|nr:AMP-binding protein [Kitasatospora sp. MAP5-34]MDH6577494.1 acyl-CoA synthetase (AMP-forming)/AMP-acid ligase II [Kitasatospora sp. MAP5-34]